MSNGLVADRNYWVNRKSKLILRLGFKKNQRAFEQCLHAISKCNEEITKLGRIIKDGNYY
jgi:hypothetical protein